MMRWLVNRMIDRAERRMGYDMDYLRALYAASPSAFHSFNKVSALSQHRRAAPADACNAARLVGALTEDCGPCTQIVVDMARAQGMADARIAAVIEGDLEAMGPEAALGYRFACAIIARLPEADTLREEVRRHWGDVGVVDLTLGAQFSRTYPMLKAGLGFAKSCGPVRIGTLSVIPASP